jgi:iron complex outermembrane receptor protein
VQEQDFINPDLRPEDALTQTAGLLWRGGSEHRFRVALDFVETRKVNELVTLDVQTILNLEHLFPDRVFRRTEADAGGAVGTVKSVVTGAINSAWRRSHNWNASLDYARTHFLGGTLEAYGRLIYYTRYDHLLVPGAPSIDELTHPEGAANNLLRYRAKFGAGWSGNRGASDSTATIFTRASCRVRNGTSRGAIASAPTGRVTLSCRVRCRTSSAGCPTA